MRYELLPSLFALPTMEVFPVASGETTQGRAETRRLEGPVAIRLERAEKFKKIEVRSGVVWLTGTPADGDVILKPGQSYKFKHCWPYVIEAIEPAEVVLA